MQHMYRDAVRLVLISFLSLYFELTLIRWIPTQVRLLAYFTNFVLIAALLGLGVGMLVAGRRFRLATLFPLGLLVLTSFVVVLQMRGLVLPIVSTGQFIWDYVKHLPITGVFAYFIVLLFFLAMVGVFALLGQEVGRALRTFSPLRAYSLNIVGSLLGVLGFAAVNRLEVPPVVWFAIGSLGYALYLLSVFAPWRALLTSLPLLAVLGVVYANSLDVPRGVSTYWSPYYKVQVEPKLVAGQRVGHTIAVNQDSFQFALDLSGRYRRIPYMAAREKQYDMPFSLSHPKHILVLGAGTGNDVAAALRNDPTATVDAVEIDPMIARLGRQIHPEQPYASPHVRLHVTDARSFLQQTSQKYDLIVFGKLDSHRVFSHMSSVRMDNYVYTKENMATVRRHLAPGGLLAIGFVVHEKWIAQRLFTLLYHVFRHAPLVYQTTNLAYDTLFFIGDRHRGIPAGAPTITHQRFLRDVLVGDAAGTWRYSRLEGFISPHEFSSRGTLLSDDWPYLYMRERSIPANYLLVLVLTVLVSVVLIWLVVPSLDFRSAANWNFFLLGAGFALQETKGITDIALLFGSTWITNIIVISAILLVILLANLVVSRWGSIPLPWIYLALFASLVFNYVVPLRGLLEYGFWLQVAASGARVAGPLFFSGMIFARWFERTNNTSTALGSNLMGAVVGGLAEYSSLALGLNQLYLLALLCYALSFTLGYLPPGVSFSVRRLPARIGMRT